MPSKTKDTNTKVKSAPKKPNEGKIEVVDNANKKGLQVMRGRVVSAKNSMTATVLIESTKVHPLYKKSYRSSKRYLVHDEMKVSEGDLVEIVKIRPVSSHKHFKIVKVVGRDIEAIVTEQLKEGAAEAIAEVMPEEKIEEVVEIEDKTENKEEK